MKLSVVVPVFNERITIKEVCDRIKGVDINKEIILLDDCSTEGTREIIKELACDNTTAYFREKNLGKGAALRTGFQKATGNILIIQDADLEYDPNEYPKLIAPYLKARLMWFAVRVLQGVRPKGLIFLAYGEQ